MKLIGFKELNGCNSCLESLHSNISDVEYENKEQILNYLKKETFIFVRLDILRDIFTGDTISYENRVLGDNEYVWSDELIYYVEKYNAKLPVSYTHLTLPTICSV